VTAQSGDLAKTASGVGTAAVAGDFDNDGKVDLFVLRYRASALYHNDGNGHFTDVTPGKTSGLSLPVDVGCLC